MSIWEWLGLWLLISVAVSPAIGWLFHREAPKPSDQPDDIVRRNLHA